MRTCCLTVGLALTIPFLAGAQGVPIVFDLPTGVSASNVFVQFLNTADSITGYYRDAAGAYHSLATSTGYRLADLVSSPYALAAGVPSNKPALMISALYSGRIYINFGTNGLTGMGGAYFPDATFAGDPNYLVRYQYLEPTIYGDDAHINLSYIDFTAIPMSMRAINAPHAEFSPQLTVVDAITMAQAAANSSLVPSNTVIPSPGDILPSTNFVRVLSPQLGMGADFHGWTNYLCSTLQGKTNIIQGIFAGVGNQPSGVPATQQQTYDFRITFDAAGNALLVGQPGSGNGYSAAIPPIIQGPGVGDSGVTIWVAYADLNSAVGIYGNNPAYTTINNGVTNRTLGIENDFYGWVVGDVMAGLSWGFLGSTVDFRGTAICDMPSAAWWGQILTNGVKPNLADTPAGQGLVFDKAQPGQPENYHTYARNLNGLTTGYGFALEDRIGNNLLHLNTSTDPGSYLLISIVQDRDPRTTLEILNSGNPDAVVLRWPLAEAAFNLFSQASINGPAWHAVTDPRILVDSYVVVTNQVTNTVMFYRLEK